MNTHSSATVYGVNLLPSSIRQGMNDYRDHYLVELFRSTQTLATSVTQVSTPLMSSGTMGASTQLASDDGYVVAVTSHAFDTSKEYVDGLLAIRISLYDYAGNSTQYILHRDRDTVAPHIDLLSSTPINVASSLSYVLSSSLSAYLDAISIHLQDSTPFYVDSTLLVSTLLRTTTEVGGIDPIDYEDAVFGVSQFVPASGLYRSRGVNTSALSDGSITVTLKVTDKAYNMSSIRVSVLRDTVMPTLADIVGNLVLSSTTSYALAQGVRYSTSVAALARLTMGHVEFSTRVIGLNNLQDYRVYGRATTVTDYYRRADHYRVTLLQASSSVRLLSSTGELMLASTDLNSLAYRIYQSTDTSWTLGTTALNAVSLPDGELDLRVEVYDYAGNRIEQVHSIYKDTLRPELYAFNQWSTDARDLGHRFDAEVVDNPFYIKISNSTSYVVSGYASSAGDYFALRLTDHVGGYLFTTGRVSFASTKALMVDGTTRVGYLVETTGLDTRALRDGTITLTLLLLDAAGNDRGTTVETFKDTVRPRVNQLTLPTVNIASSGAYRFDLSGTSLQDRFYVRFNAPWNALISTPVDGNEVLSPLTMKSTAYDLTHFGVLDQSTLNVQLELRDRVGNSFFSSRVVNYDTESPMLGLPSSTPVNMYNGRRYQLLASATTNGDSFTVRATDWTGNYLDYSSSSQLVKQNQVNVSPFALTSLADGTLTFLLRVTDAAENWVSTEVAVSKDTNPPEVDLIPRTPINLSNQYAYTLRLNAREAGDFYDLLVTDGVYRSSSYSGVITSTGGLSNSTGIYHASSLNTLPLRQGSVTLSVFLRDAAGNRASSEALIYKDLERPLVMGVSSEVVINIASESSQSYIVLASSLNNVLTDEVILSLRDGSNQAVISTGLWTSSRVLMSGIDTRVLREGTLSLSLTAIDRALNASSRSWTVFKDVTRPSLTLSAYRHGFNLHASTLNASTLSVTFAFSEGIADFISISTPLLQSRLLSTGLTLYDVVRLSTGTRTTPERYEVYFNVGVADDSSGVVGLRVLDDAFHDLAVSKPNATLAQRLSDGNGSLASNALSFNIFRVRPRIAQVSAYSPIVLRQLEYVRPAVVDENQQAQTSFTLTFDFSEWVAHFTTAQVSLLGFNIPSTVLAVRMDQSHLYSTHLSHVSRPLATTYSKRF